MALEGIGIKLWIDMNGWKYNGQVLTFEWPLFTLLEGIEIT
jgi:hypothetical protein